MCGIAGIISNQFSEEERHLFVSRMMQYIENRGPDEKGIYSYKKSTFGFARLSIREISNGSRINGANRESKVRHEPTFSLRTPTSKNCQ